MRVVRWVIVLLTVAVCGDQKPRWLAALNIGTQPPELYGRVFQRLGRPRVDHALQLGDCVQQFVDPLAGLGPGQGGGQAGTGMAGKNKKAGVTRYYLHHPAQP